MAGINRYAWDKRGVKVFGMQKVAASTERCIFISHSNIDTEMALAVAAYLLELGKSLGFDIYIDDDDKGLSAAVREANHTKIVECIEEALNRSTHLLGIITNKTRSSWWVPYEIGAARAVEKEAAFLIEKETVELPSYLEIAKRLGGEKELVEWAESISCPPRQKIASQELLTRKIVGFCSWSDGRLSDFLPITRSAEDFDFKNPDRL